MQRNKEEAKEGATGTKRCFQSACHYGVFAYGKAHWACLEDTDLLVLQKFSDAKSDENSAAAVLRFMPIFDENLHLEDPKDCTHDL